MVVVNQRKKLDQEKQQLQAEEDGQGERLLDLSSSSSIDSASSSSSSSSMLDGKHPPTPLLSPRTMMMTSTTYVKGAARVCRLHETPLYMRGNEYVLTGYRVDFTFWQALQSIFCVHNETMNIWTHLLGFFFFVALIPYSLATWLADAPFADQCMFCVWGASVAFQNFASSYFHCFSCTNKSHFHFGARLDYTAIAVLIVGSDYPIFQFLFYCHTFWKFFYLSVFTVTGIAAIVLSWHPYFAKPHLQALRAMAYIAMALFPVLAIPHYAFLIPSFWIAFPCLWRLLMMGVTYIGGAYIYATKIPEKYFPGRFDVFSSHVIWHLFTLAAACWHYSAIKAAYAMHLEYTATCPEEENALLLTLE